MSKVVFLRSLETVLSDEQKARAEYHKGKAYAHYPSSASCRLASGSVVGACNRSLYWKAKGEPSEREDSLASVLQRGFGDAIHDWLFNKLKKSSAFTIQSELGGRLKVDGLTKEVSYRLDGIALVDGRKVGVELKTTQGRGLDKLIKEGGPKEHHLLQVFDYFVAHPDINEFCLVYVSRDSGYSVEYLIERKGDDFYLTQTYPTTGSARKIEGISVEGAKKRRMELEKALETDTLPPRDYSVFLNKQGEVQEIRTRAGEKFKSDFWCLYCDYQKKCWSMPDAKDHEKRID